MKSSLLTALTIVFLTLPFVLLADTDAALTGDWGGTRKILRDQGFEFTLRSKTDFVWNAQGGLKRKSLFLGNLDLKADIDAEKLAGITGLSASIYGLVNYGGKPSKHIGDSQSTSNIEAPTTAKLYEAWLQQNFFEDRLSFLVGLHDVNSEFYVTDSSGLFLNSSFGIGKEVAQSGQNGPSIFPTTSLAGRFALQLEHFDFGFLVADGVPGDPNKAKGTYIKFKKSDGLFYISEAAYRRGKDEASTELPAKYAFGGWFYSAKFDRLDVNRRNHSYGFYFLADQNFTENFSAFVRAGKASDSVHESAYNFSGGINYKGLIPSRAEDNFGLAATSALTSRAYRASVRANGEKAQRAETTLELTYRIEAFRGVAIQPDYQFVINPSANPTIKDAHVIGLRTEINF